MSATRLEIAQWYNQGVEDGARYMIIACDEFDHDNYPVYADTAKEVHDEYDRLMAAPMSGIDEIYDLQGNKLKQFLAPRVWDLPPAHAA